MIPVINDIDQLLQAASVRVLNPTNAAVILTPSAPAFHLDASGMADIDSITVTVTLIGLDDEITFSVQGGSLSNITEKTATLTLASMPGRLAIVTAAVLSGGEEFTGSCVIPTLQDGSVGEAQFVWIKYADGPNGEGLSDLPDGKSYIGLAQNKTTATEGTNPAEYRWSLIKGTDGQPGGKGADGKTFYTWIKYSDNADGTEMYDVPTESTAYIGIAINKETATEGTDKGDYTWSKFRGSDGVSVPGSRGAGFYRTTGSAWSDATADAITPGGNVVGDIVTISNGTVSYTKEWDGSVWFFPGAFLPGNLLVERSIFAALIAVEAVRAEHIRANEIEARHLKVDSVTASKIAAGAIQARHIAVTGSPDNLIRDPQFKDLNWWGRPGCAVGDWTTHTDNTPWKGGASLYLGPGTGAQRESDTPYFNIEPGATYRLELQISVPADFNGSASIFLLVPANYWWPMSGAPGRRGLWPDNLFKDFTAADAGQLLTFSTLLTIPTDSRNSRALIRIRDQYTSSQLEIGAMSISRVTDSTLIGPGSVQTKHLSIVNGGDISSGQTGFNQGIGFYIEGAGNGHGARMSIGDSGGPRMVVDPNNGVFDMVGPSINNPKIATPFNVSAPSPYITGQLNNTPVQIAVDPVFSSGSNSYALTWSFSTSGPSSLMNMVSSPAATTLVVSAQGNETWLYGYYSLTVKDLNTGATATTSGQITIQFGSADPA